MRGILGVATALALVLAPALGGAQPPSGNPNNGEFNGADIAAKYPPPVEAANGMVVTSNHYASQVGADVLKAGGNAVDAAVAVGYALAVTHSFAGNIGGGGFATIHLANGKNSFINFREKAPAAASANMYLDANGAIVPGLSLRGYKAVGVPGTVMGMEKMLTEYGTWTRERAMAPAIKLADEGYELWESDARGFANHPRTFANQPNVMAIFTNGGKPWVKGDRFTQKQLAATLKEISDKGPDAFYKGDIAQRVGEASAANGGLITAKDFADYTVTEGQPLTCDYRGYRVISTPPPSSGGASMCEILNILAGYPMDKLPGHGAQSVHLMVEAMRHAYVDRNFQLGDPDFWKNPLDLLLSKTHAANIRKAIDPVKATPSAQVKIGTEPHETEQTTH